MTPIVCESRWEPELRRLLGERIDRFRVVAHLPESSTGYFLRYEESGFSLHKSGDVKGVRLTERDVVLRRRGEFLLGRACGVGGRRALDIVDATAGFGIDGLALAMSGQRVTLLEREPALWALVLDFAGRVGVDTGAVLNVDADDYLPGHLCDVVYFDPMFPVRSKQALPNKRMQYLAGMLAETEPFEPGLLDVARQSARLRVVLKRRLKDPIVDPPDWQLRGKMVRYDVYRGAADQPSRSTA